MKFTTAVVAVLPALALAAPSRMEKVKRDVCDWTFAQDCGKADGSMLFDPWTQKCYSPAAHPSPYNCAWQNMAFDKEAQVCVPLDVPTPDCFSKCMLFDPNTVGCYNGDVHPGDFACSLKGQAYSPYTGQCYTLE